jgi:hypothetical protein
LESFGRVAVEAILHRLAQWAETAIQHKANCLPQTLQLPFYLRRQHHGSNLTIRFREEHVLEGSALLLVKLQTRLHALAQQESAIVTLLTF